MKIELVNVGVNRWEAKREGQVGARMMVYAKKELLAQIGKDQSLQQLAEAASLPGVISPIVAMPDMHEGFGLPIGGVMATENLVSSGAVGMDINCGVRLLMSQVKYDKAVMTGEMWRRVMERIERKIPVGLGRGGARTPVRFEEVIYEGAKSLVEKGEGEAEDIEAIEEGGRLAGADVGALSARAVKRAERELASLGSGNHFVDVQYVETIWDKDLARQWGMFEGEICVMIHTGSRALGHQTCIDYTERFFREEGKYGMRAPSRNLASLPADSALGKRYLAAMAGCVNFAFANRQLIGQRVREVFCEEFGEEEKLRLLYDVAHNIAKWEVHRGRKVLVHRKGATRALPAGHAQNVARYMKTGQPAIVPGSMGTASYVMVGLPAAAETYFSINHGAGRAMSRGEAKRTISEGEFEARMEGVVCNLPFRAIADEAPQAYKDIELVGESLTEAGMAKKVVGLKPLAVVIGK